MWRYIDYINANLFDISVNIAAILMVFAACRLLKVRAPLALAFSLMPIFMVWYTSTPSWQL